ncbi:MAG TPA: DUF4423 domain-containing protein [Bdellovibrionota bacterium]|jgi:uncharacterized protein (TIGR02147 family)|nr:DUF4423 domain-containing protein [Bdellovibrionota bacterium]
MQAPYYLERIEGEFRRRQEANPAYSLRSFAKFLGLDSSTLASILRRKRGLPLKSAERVAQKLGMSPAQKQEFVRSVYHARASLAGTDAIPQLAPASLLKEELHYRIIAEWEHYAVYSLLESRGSRTEVAWIADRMGITPARAENVLNRLLEAGLVTRTAKGRHTCQMARLETSDDVLSQSLQRAHTEALELALKKLTAVDVKSREYSSETIAFDLKKLPQAKALMREFSERFASLMKSSAGSTVYQLNLQFFPLSKIDSPKIAKEPNHELSL